MHRVEGLLVVSGQYETASTLCHCAAIFGLNHMSFLWKGHGPQNGGISQFWSIAFQLQSYNPSGFKDPNNRVLGPKYYNIYGAWALKPYYLGPWTLREHITLSGPSTASTTAWCESELGTKTRTQWRSSPSLVVWAFEFVLPT